MHHFAFPTLGFLFPGRLGVWLLMVGAFTGATMFLVGAYSLITGVMPQAEKSRYLASLLGLKDKSARAFGVIQIVAGGALAFFSLFGLVYLGSSNSADDEEVVEQAKVERERNAGPGFEDPEYARGKVLGNPVVASGGGVYATAEESSKAKTKAASAIGLPHAVRSSLYPAPKDGDSAGEASTIAASLVSTPIAAGNPGEAKNAPENNSPNAFARLPALSARTQELPLAPEGAKSREIPRADNTKVKVEFTHTSPNQGWLIGFRFRKKADGHIGAMQSVFQHGKQVSTFEWCGPSDGDEVEILAPEGYVVWAVQFSELKGELCSARALFGPVNEVDGSPDADWSPWIGEEQSDQIILDSTGAGISQIVGSASEHLRIGSAFAWVNASGAGDAEFAQGAADNPPGTFRAEKDGRLVFAEVDPNGHPLQTLFLHSGLGVNQNRVAAVGPIFYDGRSQIIRQVWGKQAAGPTWKKLEILPGTLIAGLRVYKQGAGVASISVAYAPLVNNQLDMSRVGMTASFPDPKALDSFPYTDLTGRGRPAFGITGEIVDGQLVSINLLYSPILDAKKVQSALEKTVNNSGSTSKSANRGAALGDGDSDDSADADKKIVDPKKAEEIAARRRKQTGMRKWTLVEDEKTLEAKFVALRSSGQVLLRGINDELIKVQLKDLSEPDQAYVKKRSATKVKP